MLFAKLFSILLRIHFTNKPDNLILQSRERKILTKIKLFEDSSKEKNLGLLGRKHHEQKPKPQCETSSETVPVS